MIPYIGIPRPVPSNYHYSHPKACHARPRSPSPFLRYISIFFYKYKHWDWGMLEGNIRVLGRGNGGGGHSRGSQGMTYASPMGLQGITTQVAWGGRGSFPVMARTGGCE